MNAEELNAIKERAEKATGELPFDEEWRSIEGLDGMYEVSNFGNVRSRLKPGNHRNKLGNPRILKVRLDKRGYGTISLPFGHGGKYVTKSVHTLVANEFLGKRPEGKEIAHLNGDSTDNRACNLEYVTHKENESHKKLHGTLPLGSANGNTNYVGWQIEIVRYLAEKGVPQAKIAKLFDMSVQMVSSVVLRESWPHVGTYKDTPALIAEVERLRSVIWRISELYDISVEETREFLGERRVVE